MTDPANGVTNYSYDSLNRLTNLSDFNSNSFGFSYDALSRRTQLTRPNGVSTNYVYDNLSRLLSVLHQVGLTTIDGATYTYDNAGNRTSKLNQLNAVTENYTYDQIYQLTQVVQGLNTTEAYTYDAVGNRLSTVSDTGWTYDSSNHLTSRPGVTYTYDNNGNTATKVDASGTTTYAWDYLNRLTSVTLPGSGGTVTSKYDPFGRRIQKVSAAGTTNYIYDGANVVEEVDGTGTVLARYSQGPGVDQPLSDVVGGVAKFYDADGLGSITSLADISASLTDTYVTDSFGKTVTSTGTTRNPFRYTARDLDSETGLYYYRARYYDPQTGRFINEDPIAFAAGINFYAYVKSSPINLVDPTGYSDACTFGGCSGARKPSLPDAQFADGASDMWRNYQRMEQRQWIGADKYYHCMANCQATNRGLGGTVAAKVISFIRTNIISRFREPDDWQNDDKANKCGQQGGDCNARCAQFIPKSSPGKPPFPGW